MLHAVTGWIILNNWSDFSAFIFRFKQLNYLHPEDKTLYDPLMSEAIFLGAQCNIPQHFKIQKLTRTKTYVTDMWRLDMQDTAAQNSSPL
jgi:hypothetical protein